MLDARWLDVYPQVQAQARRYAAAVTGDPSDGDDALHDVYLRLLARPPRVQPGDNPGGLVWQATRRRILDIMRYRARRPSITIPPEWTSGAIAGRSRAEAESRVPPALIDPEMPDELVLARDEHRRVREALARLPAHHRQALVEHYWEGRRMSGDPTFKSRVQRARRQFRAHWEPLVA